MTTGQPPPKPYPPAAPDRQRRVGLVVAALALAGALVAGIAVWVVSSAGRWNDDPGAVGVTPANVRPGSQAPAAAAQPVPAADLVAGWADRTARTVGVPARALRAYALTDVVLRTEAPHCRLSWVTLAGIGRVESNHGRFAGARLDADGRPSPPIVGVPLDGSPGVREVPDTDGGRFDGDSAHDRAVGPMQFIPSTWARWASDGDGDKLADPHDLDDAALAAGRYLCDKGRDTATPAGWWAAVLAYNNSVDYGQRVFGVADSYARSAPPG